MTSRASHVPPDFRPDPVAALRILDRDQCWTCERSGAPLRCSVCGLARYCGPACQSQAKPQHTLYCDVKQEQS